MENQDVITIANVSERNIREYAIFDSQCYKLHNRYDRDHYYVIRVQIHDVSEVADYWEIPRSCKK